MTEARIVLTIEGKKLNNAGRPAYGVVFRKTHDTVSDEFDPNNVNRETLTKGGAVVAAVAMVAEDVIKVALESPAAKAMFAHAAKVACDEWDRVHGFDGAPENKAQVVIKEKMEAME